MSYVVEKMWGLKEKDELVNAGFIVYPDDDNKSIFVQVWSAMTKSLVFETNKENKNRRKAQTAVAKYIINNVPEWKERMIKNMFN